MRSPKAEGRRDRAAGASLSCVILHDGQAERTRERKRILYMYLSTAGVGVRVGRGDSTIQGTVLKRFLLYSTHDRGQTKRMHGRLVEPQFVSARSFAAAHHQ